MHQTSEAFWCLIGNLMATTPACWNQDTQQENDGINEEYTHRLRDREVERAHFCAVLLQLNDTTFVVPLRCNE